MFSLFIIFFFVFFKQKTAYEFRIRDWSSDVCSSDLSYADHPARSWDRRSGASVPSDEPDLIAFSASPPYHPAGSERHGTGPTSSTSESWGSADMLRPPPNVRMAPTGNAGHGYSRPPQFFLVRPVASQNPEPCPHPPARVGKGPVRPGEQR